MSDPEDPAEAVVDVTSDVTSDVAPDTTTNVTPDPAVDPGAAAAAASAALRRLTGSTKRSSSTRRRRRAPGTSGRDPVTLAAALEGLVQEQGWEHESAVAVLMAEWAQIVGQDLAEHVRPVSFADGELVLQAESTAWATQVRLLLPQLHRTVDERVGAGVVRAIRIRGPQAPSWGAGPRRVPGRGPRDTYG